MTRQINVGGVKIGGGAPVSVQSMTNTDTRDAAATIAQINRLTAAGCDIVRVAVPDTEAAKKLGDIVSASPIPVVADIHFDHRLALLAIEHGVHKVRVNPGNIGSKERVREVARACLERGIPIRIGVNGGSADPDLIKKYGLVDAMVRSALDQQHMLEDYGLTDICVSLKASRVRETIEAIQSFSSQSDCPVHLGVTEAGTQYNGIIKNSIGIGALLCSDIGDTIRVSLTADPVEEVRAGIVILGACGLRNNGVELVSCPMCGRCRINVESLASEMEHALADITVPLRVAVMGCVVNGPGEARDADCGIAGGDGKAILFVHGEKIKTILSDDIVSELSKTAHEIAKRKGFN